jgi:hypothetical protein
MLVRCEVTFGHMMVVVSTPQVLQVQWHGYHSQVVLKWIVVLAGVVAVFLGGALGLRGGFMMFWLG